VNWTIHTLALPRHLFAKLKKAIAGGARSALGVLTHAQTAGNIAMFHVGRCGSTVLGDMLDQHPMIHWDGEIYERLLKSNRISQDVTQKSSLHIAADPIGLLTSHMRRAGRQYYGIEVKPFHLDLLGIDLNHFLRALEAKRFNHLIILQRRNHLRKIVSSTIAHKTRQFHRSANSSSLMTKIHLDLEHVQIDRQEKPLIEFLGEYTAFFDTLGQLLSPRNRLWLTYEDDVSPNPQMAYRRVCAFLGVVPGNAPAVRYGITNPYPLPEVITNFAQVEARLKGTEFEWMLYR
jgi:hypothetical protein